MKLKIAICDDEAAQRDYLLNTVDVWAKKNRHMTEVKDYPSAEAFLFDYEEEKDFDILLLDIEMTGMSGVELAKRVRQENSTIQLVFITGFYEYFGDGFDVSALHYLIKPANVDKLYPVLDRAVDNLSYRQRSVLLNTSEGDIKLSLADIMYIEADKMYLMVHSLKETHRVRMTLAKMTELLDDTFFKVHRSYIVGLKYVKKITHTDIFMANGDVVPISRGMYQEVHEALIKNL